MNVIRTIATFTLSTLIISGCRSNDRSPVSPTPPVIEDSDSCAQACERLSSLGCAEGLPVASGVECVGDHDCREGSQCVDRVCHDSCETFCRETQAWGVWLQPRCVAQINACYEVDRCD